MRRPNPLPQTVRRARARQARNQAASLHREARYLTHTGLTYEQAALVRRGVPTAWAKEYDQRHEALLELAASNRAVASQAFLPPVWVKQVQQAYTQQTAHLDRLQVAMTRQFHSAGSPWVLRRR